MNFIDEAFLEVRAGNGGAGASSFRREKYIPFGGPDGGDGGKGGDIFFRVNQNKNTLIDFQNKRVFLAKNGRPGAGKNKSGSAAEDLIIDIPKGTVIYDDISGDELLDCCDDDASYLIAKGGDGGQGNARFKSSTNQAPRKFTLGFEGEVRFIRLELKSLADVGLVGFPNAGKSTFLNKVSSAKPKIGSYPFTTLRPHLGTIEGSDSSFVIADIPGLIEGASEGAGLGIKFLQHISRTGLLLIFVDLYSSENLDPITQIKLLKKELSAYKDDLTQKVSWIICNKIDLLDEKELVSHSDKIQEILNIGNDEIFFISAATGEGTQKLLQSLEEVISQSKLGLA
jgi:GTP-binding protein